jgi:hypothetical protein
MPVLPAWHQRERAVAWSAALSAHSAPRVHKLYPRGFSWVGLLGCGDRRCHREVGSGVHVEIPCRRAASARFGHAQAIVRCGGPVQFKLGVRIFSRKSQTDAPTIVEATVFTAFRNNGRMPLICPTCQVAFSNAGERLLLCMGLFSIFWEGMPEAQLPNPSPPAAA